MAQGNGFASRNASLLSAAPMKPTGHPIIAAGRGQSGSSNMFNKWNSAVGALPIATNAPSRCGRHNSSAAAERVLDISLAMSGTRGSRRVQITSLSAGRRFRVTPSDTMYASHRIGAPFCNAARAAGPNVSEKCTCFARSTMPAAWIIRTAMLS